MAYFSNGSEGADYREHYCSICAHDAQRNCPVWLLHLNYNGEQHAEYAKNEQDKGRREAIGEILSSLIPRDGTRNGKCNFFQKIEA